MFRATDIFLDIHTLSSLISHDCCDIQAPFPNGGFMNGYSSSGNYKANSSSNNTHRPMSRNR